MDLKDVNIVSTKTFFWVIPALACLFLYFKKMIIKKVLLLILFSVLVSRIAVSLTNKKINE